MTGGRFSKKFREKKCTLSQADDQEEFDEPDILTSSVETGGDLNGGLDLLLASLNDIAHRTNQADLDQAVADEIIADLDGLDLGDLAKFRTTGEDHPPHDDVQAAPSPRRPLKLKRGEGRRTWHRNTKAHRFSMARAALDAMPGDTVGWTVRMTTPASMAVATAENGRRDLKRRVLYQLGIAKVPVVDPALVMRLEPVSGKAGAYFHSHLALKMDGRKPSREAVAEALRIAHGEWAADAGRQYQAVPTVNPGDQWWAERMPPDRGKLLFSPLLRARAKVAHSDQNDER